MSNGASNDALVLLLYINVTRKTCSLYMTCLQGIMGSCAHQNKSKMVNTATMIPCRRVS